MKLDDFEEKFPLEETIRMLNEEAPGQPSLERAEELIDHQRASQVPILVREMYGPILATEPEAARDDPTVDSSTSPRFRFKDPDRVAQISLRAAAQVGASLRAFRPEELTGLQPSDESLGRLLCLLSIEEEKPPDLDRRRAEWAVSFPEELDTDAEAPLGPVLTPMFLLSLPAPQVEGLSTEALAGPLVAELTGMDRGEELVTWAADVVEAGAAAIDAADEVHPSPLLEPFLAARMEALARRPAHARDIVLVGTRDENSFFLREVRHRLDVEEPTRFIYEPEPGLVRLRAWSQGELSPERLTEIADSLDANIVEMLDDTVI